MVRAANSGISMTGIIDTSYRFAQRYRMHVDMTGIEHNAARRPSCVCSDASAGIIYMEFTTIPREVTEATELRRCFATVDWQSGNRAFSPLAAFRTSALASLQCGNGGPMEC
jgi:hypothetical protein